MAYQKQIWKNGESALNQDTLNHMEDGIAGAHELISHLPTHEEVQAAISAIPAPNFNGYVTKTELTHELNAILSNTLGISALNNYTTRAEANQIAINKIEELIIGGYATSNQLLAVERKIPKLHSSGTEITGLVREYVYEVDAVNGVWSIDLSPLGFTKFVNVIPSAYTDTLSGLTLKPTLLTATGYLVSTTSAGLLAAMKLVNASGKVLLTVKGI